MKIINIEGAAIESLILDASTSSAADKETAIENVKAGIYFVEIKIENAVYRKKVVVLK